MVTFESFSLSNRTRPRPSDFFAFKGLERSILPFLGRRIRVGAKRVKRDALLTPNLLFHRRRQRPLLRTITKLRSVSSLRDALANISYLTIERRPKAMVSHSG
jgi:hypothetical protein